MTDHIAPSSSFCFPKVFNNGCFRSFQYKWLEKYPWLVYSKVLNGGFCKFCALFAKNREKCGALVNKPFETWIKVHKVVDGHASNQYHVNAVTDATAFINSVKNPHVNIDVRMNTELLHNIEQNRKILKYCIESILYCGRQCIALRGHNENLESPANPGNFLAMLRVLANHDPLLKSHLDNPQLKNATYISPDIQNQLANIIGKLVIQKDIINEILHAKYYSIMVDEVTSHNQELMPLCIRFVDSKYCIREEFMQFSSLSRITGESIASVILSDLEQLGLDVCNIRGQGYDGASNMSSDRVGVQALIREKAPLAVYTHCAGHCLNLVIVHSCDLLTVRNVIDKMKATCLFFLNSPKRSKLLLEIVTRGIAQVSKRSPLLDLCKTRWAARHTAYQHFYQCFKFIVTAYEAIAFGQHRDVLSADFNTATWDPESKSKANSLLTGITDFDFIIVFLTIYQFLSHLAGITVKLQSSTLDILKAYKEIDDIKSYLKSLRDKISPEFHKVFLQAERMGASVNVDPSRPRSCTRQRNRPNAEADSVEDWYRVNVAIPFLDHIIAELDSQFSQLAKTASQLLCLVPSVMSSSSSSSDSNNLDELVELYKDDLPSPELFNQEFSRWQHNFQTRESRPDSCAEALKKCDRTIFPNVYILLQIACTIPVTSCECERNASALRQLHDYKRTTMTVERLTSLALMYIHYEHPVNYDNVVDIFAELHPRRLRFSSVLLST